MKTKLFVKFVLILSAIAFWGLVVLNVIAITAKRAPQQQALNSARASVGFLNKDGKIGICHYTGSDKKPYDYIEVSPAAAEKHKSHHNDKIGVKSAAECPKGKPNSTSVPPRPTEEEETAVPTKADATEKPEETPAGDAATSTPRPDNTPADETVMPPATKPATTDLVNTLTPAPSITTTPVPAATLSLTQLVTKISSTAPVTSEVDTNETKVVPQPIASALVNQDIDLQKELARVQAQLERAQRDKKHLDDELREIAKQLADAEVALDMQKGDNRVLRQQIDDLKEKLDELGMQKVANDQEIKDLQNMVRILREVIAARAADKEEALWTKIAAIIAGMGFFAMVLRTWGKNIGSFIQELPQWLHGIFRPGQLPKLRSISIHSPVSRGSTVPVDVDVAPGVVCVATVTDSSGTKKRLDPMPSRKNGKLSWQLAIDATANPGKWKVRIECLSSGQSQEREFEVI